MRSQPQACGAMTIATSIFKQAILSLTVKSSVICETDAMLDPTSGNIDMSFRLWSDRVSLAPLAAHLGFDIAHLHVKGAPMSEAGVLSGRIAKRHYASMEARKGATSHDVRLWIQRVAKTVCHHPSIVDDFRSEAIEGVLWIAVLRGEPSSRPKIASESVSSVESLGLSILIEDYTDRSAKTPTKIWFPARVPLQYADA